MHINNQIKQLEKMNEGNSLQLRNQFREINTLLNRADLTLSRISEYYDVASDEYEAIDEGQRHLSKALAVISKVENSDEFVDD